MPGCLRGIPGETPRLLEAAPCGRTNPFIAHATCGAQLVFRLFQKRCFARGLHFRTWVAVIAVRFLAGRFRGVL